MNDTDPRLERFLVELNVVGLDYTDPDGVDQTKYSESEPCVYCQLVVDHPLLVVVHVDDLYASHPAQYDMVIVLCADVNACMLRGAVS